MAYHRHVELTPSFFRIDVQGGTCHTHEPPITSSQNQGSDVSAPHVNIALPKVEEVSDLYSFFRMGALIAYQIALRDPYPGRRHSATKRLIRGSNSNYDRNGTGTGRCTGPEGGPTVLSLQIVFCGSVRQARRYVVWTHLLPQVRINHVHAAVPKMTVAFTVYVAASCERSRRRCVARSARDHPLYLCMPGFTLKLVRGTNVEGRACTCQKRLEPGGLLSMRRRTFERVA